MNLSDKVHKKPVTVLYNVGITLIQMMHTNSHRVLDFAAHLECTHLHIVDLKKSFQLSIVAQLDI